MKHKLKRDKFYRRNYTNNEYFINFFRAITRSQHLKISRRTFFFFYAKKKPIFSGFFESRIRNHSINNTRPRSVSRFFRLSRIDFRYFASYGLISGVKKSSWLIKLLIIKKYIKKVQNFL